MEAAIPDRLKALVPERSALLSLAIPDLAGHLLAALRGDGVVNVHRPTVCTGAGVLYRPNPYGQDQEVTTAISTAWDWLVSNGFLCHAPEDSNDRYRATKLGASVATQADLKGMIEERELPASFLHPDLLVHARPVFRQHRFDTAVLEAFKALEVGRDLP